MTGFSDRSQAEDFAAHLPPSPSAEFNWVEFLEGPITAAGFNTDDIRLIHAVQPPAFQLIGDTKEKWVVEYDGEATIWAVREWDQADNKYAAGDWNEDLD